MSVVKSKLGLLSCSSETISQFAEQSPLILDINNFKQQEFNIDLLIIDNSFNLSISDLNFINQKKNHSISQVIYALKPESPLPPEILLSHAIDFYLYIEEINTDFLMQQLDAITQKEQDLTYIHLSAELNQQYEIIKTELESKLKEKSKNLIESRKQIYEINNRVEVLRKSLFATSEVKNLAQAETVLNNLLVGYHLVTWIKIVFTEQAKQFEINLTSQFDSTYYATEITINSESHRIYFFKGDKRTFRKNDINYFNKLSEALQINLNRYNNLLSLQQNERLFDLAFHSSPHPIIVIDNEYNIFQANLAAEQKSNNDNDSVKCFEMLYGRNKPCTGCHLGTKFEINHDVKTYSVQSNKFNTSINSDKSYWIHFYEDISEQKSLEIKFQQTAKLSELGLISSSIAHELNNPLGGILSYLQVMKMELPAKHPFLTDIEFLTEASNRMKKHIEDLLYFSRKEDVIKLEATNLNEVLQNNLNLMQLQLKKDHLIVSFQQNQAAVIHPISILHFRNSVHLVFQFLLHKLKVKKQNKANFSGLVEVKISQDHINSYLSFSANLGPHDLKLNSNDLSLVALEKSILDQAFQLVISEPQPHWLQLLFKLPR